MKNIFKFLIILFIFINSCSIFNPNDYNSQKDDEIMGNAVEKTTLTLDEVNEAIHTLFGESLDIKTANGNIIKIPSNKLVIKINKVSCNNFYTENLKIEYDGNEDIIYTADVRDELLKKLNSFPNKTINRVVFEDEPIATLNNTGLIFVLTFREKENEKAICGLIGTIVSESDKITFIKNH